MTGSPIRSASAPRISKPPQPASPKFVAPLEEMTPSALAGPGVSRPIARTAASGTPVSPSTCSTASIRDRMALSGPSLTLLGTSAIWSRRNRPSESRIVPLFVVPPLSRPTTTQSTGMRPPRPAAEPRLSLGKCVTEEQYRRRGRRRAVRHANPGGSCWHSSPGWPGSTKVRTLTRPGRTVLDWGARRRRTARSDRRRAVRDHRRRAPADRARSLRRTACHGPVPDQDVPAGAMARSTAGAVRATERP